MIEGIIVISGLFFTFFPAFIFVRYILRHSKGDTSFDNHVAFVKDKRGHIGVSIAYLERLFFGSMFLFLGLWMCDLFIEELFLLLLVLSIVFYVIFKYIDDLNEK